MCPVDHTRYHTSATRRPAYRRLLQRLRTARQEAGLTQVEVAATLGRTQAFVWKCESGERRIDPIDLKEFAILYGKTLDWFLAPND